jgi:hypothetical protein
MMNEADFAMLNSFSLVTPLRHQGLERRSSGLSFDHTLPITRLGEQPPSVLNKFDFDHNDGGYAIPRPG